VTETFGSPWVLLAAAVVGYLLGSINPAAIIARMRGVDLRGTGSGNPGATNAGRAMGRKTGVLVGVLDVLKGLIPALLFIPFGLAASEVAGFFAVIGHITSPFLKGRGGKGVATTLGALLGTQPLWVPFVLVGFAVGYLPTKRVGIGAVLASLVLLVCAALSTQPDARLFGLLLALLVLSRHWKNMVAAWQDWRHPPESSTPSPGA
jgi:acyl phosphate:glycerol-3-phosphate acyltransferase